jgi:hypothetical protein
MSWDSIASGTIDSVRIWSRPPGCRDPGQLTTIPGSNVPTGESPVFDISITQLDIHPAARTLPGQYCAFGVHPFWGPYAYVFALQIDSTDTSNVWGRWDLNYQFSHGDDAGSFVGGIAPTFLVLRLTQDPPWDTCLGMQLYVPIRADGTWGPATIYGDQECVPEPAPFTFVADTIIGMFP